MLPARGIAASPSLKLSADSESDARIFVKELTTGNSGEVTALRTEVDSLRRELQQAQDHAAQRTRDMDNMFKYEARNAENTRDIATALKSMGTGLRRLLAALPGTDPALQRGVREVASHADNLEEVMDTVTSRSQSLSLEKKPSRRTATITTASPVSTAPAASTSAVSAASAAAAAPSVSAAVPPVTLPKKSGVADAISSAVRRVSSTMEAALKKKKPSAPVSREESPAATVESSPRKSSAALFASSEQSDMDTEELDDEQVERLLLSPAPDSPRRRSPRAKKKSGEPGRRSPPPGVRSARPPRRRPGGSPRRRAG